MEGLLVSALSLPNKFLLAFHSHSFFLLLSRYLAPTCSTSRSIGLFRAHSFLFGISVPSRYPTPCSLFHLLPHFSSTLSVSISIYLSLVPSLFSSLCPRFLVSLRHSEHLPPPPPLISIFPSSAPTCPHLLIRPPSAPSLLPTPLSSSLLCLSTLPESTLPGCCNC